MSEYHAYMTDDSKPADNRLKAVRVMADFVVRLSEAEEKHPVFAEGPYEALGRIAEEQGELVRAVTKNEGEERMYDEALDVMITAFRFARGDWR